VLGPPQVEKVLGLAQVEKVLGPPQVEKLKVLGPPQVKKVLGPPQVEKVLGPPQVELKVLGPPQVELRALRPPQVALGSGPRAGGAILFSAAFPSAWASPPAFPAFSALELSSSAVALGLDPVVVAPPSPFVA
jgi:hypothetical protein